MLDCHQPIYCAETPITIAAVLVTLFGIYDRRLNLGSCAFCRATSFGVEHLAVPEQLGLRFDNHRLGKCMIQAALLLSPLLLYYC